MIPRAATETVGVLQIPAMTPLGMLVSGFALVVLDLRLDGFDAAPDALGWILAVAGLVRLTHSSRWFQLANGAAVVGVVVGLLEQVGEATGALSMLVAVQQACFVFAVCSGVAVAAGEDRRIRRTAELIRWLDLGVVVAAEVVLGASPEPALVLVLVPLGLGLATWFMIFLLSVRDHPALQAAGHPASRTG